MTDVDKISNNFAVPPPNISIYPKDWQDAPLDIRREFWILWINFRSAADGMFHQQLQIILDKRELTQKAFAEQINQSTSVVSRWLKGRKVKLEEDRHHIPEHLSIVMRIIDELDCDALEKHMLIRAYALEVLWLKGF